MRRAALLAMPAIAVLSATAPDMAAAKSKAYCRQWAEDVANRSAGGSPGVGATAGSVLSTMGEVLVGTVTANQAMPANPPANAGTAGTAKRDQIYRRAYAECRAS
jgi:hypothetical protein